MRPRILALLGVPLLLGAAAASAQDDPWRSPATHPTQDQPADQKQANPDMDQQQQKAPAMANTKVVNGTVVSFQEGKTIKVRTSDGKVKVYSLKDATVGSGIKVGGSVRVTESEDASGVRSVTVEPAKAEAS